VTSQPLETEIDVIFADEIDLDLDLNDLERLTRFALSAEKAFGHWTVAIALTSDDHLRRLHADFMSIDEVTDVMTFPVEDATGKVIGGDIVVSVDRASIQGPEEGLSEFEEIRFLCVHGVLHLCGWDDATDDDRAAMHQRQAEIIAAFSRS
jgi:probable rRNA maturation factor